MNARILTLIFAIFLLFPAMHGCGSSEAQNDTAAQTAEGDDAQQERVIPVKVEPVQPGPLKDILVLPGETEPDKDVALAAERPGQIEWVGVSEGDEVFPGRRIAMIDADSLRAALDKTEASYELAEKQADRREDLYNNNFISKEELDQTRTALTTARATLREAQVAFDQGVIESPIHGIVNDLHVDEGEYVNPGSPVADLLDIDSIRINVNVPELDVRWLKAGDKTMVRVDAYPDEMWNGVIDFVGYKADDKTKTFPVRVIVDNADGRIRPGMLARVVFLRRIIPDALSVPLFAVQDKGGERIVFVEQNGTAQSRIVEFGVLDGERVQITKGLDPGDKLIVVGQNEVEDGTKVKAQ